MSEGLRNWSQGRKRDTEVWIKEFYRDNQNVFPRNTISEPEGYAHMYTLRMQTRLAEQHSNLTINPIGFAKVMRNVLDHIKSEAWGQLRAAVKGKKFNLYNKLISGIR